ncbi:glycerol-3-phosphate acyltransferase [Poseidonocella pacifica]|uniref:Glycerol-3-phosphate acyltransferase n=1 Tax=Poseidonocella pacifica TaxID=871651 RepID=A0A1I0YXK2_9RHOB|nr:1-acyl-sn-glycerol-3-phosphate acyltransferase [Poseidonocella pacifica]SFB17912.1 glycerol-3-phosphate acyltransferase [Poseidonocella pacifica]
MTSTVELPLWLFVVILLFAAVTAASHLFFPSVRWFLRRRMERVVARLNRRLVRPIQPFKLLRRQDMIQRLVYDPEVTRAVVAHAEANNLREDVAFEIAKRYAREIVPAFSATAYFGFAIRASRWLSTALYRVRLGHWDEDAIREIDPEATVVFVMNHRSNMDYVLVTYLAADQSALSYAVGEWARTWPLSPLVRAMGAYFIRRRSRDALYRKVLAQYVRMASDAGVTQAIFPEGGLSLDGRIAPPRMGLLNYIATGDRQGGRDVVFVPVALNYDRVLEDGVLIAAQSRSERRFRGSVLVALGFILGKLWLWVTFRYRRFGYAAVQFGPPVSLAEMKRGGDDSTKALAEELFRRIKRSVPVLPVPMVCLAFEGEDELTVSVTEARVEALLARMQVSGQLPVPPRESFAGFGIRQLVDRGLLKRRGERLHAPHAKEPQRTYYANSVRHLLRESGDKIPHTDVRET